MKWLFGERFCLHTNLKPDFVMGILRENVGRTRWQEGDAIIGPEPLFDKLTVKGAGRFILRPSNQLLNRTSIRPFWRCELEADGTGSRLRVHAGSPGMLLFYAIWFGILGRWGYSAQRGKEPGGWFAGVVGFSVFFLLLDILCFWLPERKARTGLQGVLGGTFVEE